MIVQDWIFLHKSNVDVRFSDRLVGRSDMCVKQERESRKVEAILGDNFGDTRGH